RDWPQSFFRFCPRARAFLEDVPRGNNPLHSQYSLPAQPHAPSTEVNQLLKIAFEVCPANLATFGQYLLIRGEAIRTQDAVDRGAQEILQTDHTTSGLNEKSRHARGGCSPQPDQLGGLF